MLLGRPFGGCGIIYRKSLSAKVSPLPCYSKRFCAVSLSIDDKSLLCICVYLPTNYHDSQSHDEFLFALTEIEDSWTLVLFDHVIIAGDFNVDVRVPSPRALLFSSLLQNRASVCLDQLPLSTVQFTYSSSASESTSLIDHFVCSIDLAHLVSAVNPINIGANLSDHLPIFASFNICVSTLAMIDNPVGTPPRLPPRTNWDKVQEHHIVNFLNLLSDNLPVLPPEVVSCSDPFCTTHSDCINIFLQSFLDCISTASLEALPSTVSKHTHVTPGWNDFAKDLKYKANFWHRVWLEAGSPSSGVLIQIKKKAKCHFKYEVRRLKRRERYIRREKLTSAFSIRNKRKFWKQINQLKRGSHSSTNSVVDGLSDEDEISEVFRVKLMGTLNKYADSSFDPSDLDLESSDLHLLFFI